ncbi:MAG: corrinoid protein [Phycisphaeraceae bacterium]|nr:corrinoid protein [Phycisphaeraceae bacterium]
MSSLSELSQAIEKGNRAESTRITRESIAQGIPAREILDAMVAGMDVVGQKFKNNQIFVPEMLIASRAMKESLALLEPLLVKAGIQPEFSAVIGTVQGDLHDIGKNLVAMMWKGANIDVVDVGTNVSAAKFIATAKERNARIIGLSALLTTTMPAMKSTVQAIRDAGLTDVKVVIGGAPITEGFAREIGADGFAPDAASAVELARRLVGAAV